MRLKIDKESDALYFRLDDSKIIESEEVEKGVILDYNSEGMVVGIELLKISQRANHADFNKLQFESI